ncbi:UNVERIFIED_CONTAM: hypothetical protein HHA_250050 [Hammondia hammondi]|eukprot:XP_008888664.1 hypothetical protein HHA_250050 [Hammondia hammondi]
MEARVSLRPSLFCISPLCPCLLLLFSPSSSAACFFSRDFSESRRRCSIFSLSAARPAITFLPPLYPVHSSQICRPFGRPPSALPRSHSVLSVSLPHSLSVFFLPSAANTAWSVSPPSSLPQASSLFPHSPSPALSCSLSPFSLPLRSRPKRHSRSLSLLCRRRSAREEGATARERVRDEGERERERVRDEGERERERVRDEHRAGGQADISGCSCVSRRNVEGDTASARLTPGDVDSRERTTNQANRNADEGEAGEEGDDERGKGEHGGEEQEYGGRNARQLNTGREVDRRGSRGAGKAEREKDGLRGETTPSSPPANSLGGEAKQDRDVFVRPQEESRCGVEARGEHVERSLSSSVEDLNGLFLQASAAACAGRHVVLPLSLEVLGALQGDEAGLLRGEGREALQENPRERRSLSDLRSLPHSGGRDSVRVGGKGKCDSHDQPDEEKAEDAKNLRERRYSCSLSRQQELVTERRGGVECMKSARGTASSSPALKAVRLFVSTAHASRVSSLGEKCNLCVLLPQARERTGKKGDAEGAAERLRDAAARTPDDSEPQLETGRRARQPGADATTDRTATEREGCATVEEVSGQQQSEERRGGFEAGMRDFVSSISRQSPEVECCALTELRQRVLSALSTQSRHPSRLSLCPFRRLAREANAESETDPRGRQREDGDEEKKGDRRCSEGDKEKGGDRDDSEGDLKHKKEEEAKTERDVATLNASCRSDEGKRKRGGEKQQGEAKNHFVLVVPVRHSGLPPGAWRLPKRGIEKSLLKRRVSNSAFREHSLECLFPDASSSLNFGDELEETLHLLALWRRRRKPAQPAKEAAHAPKPRADTAERQRGEARGEDGKEEGRGGEEGDGQQEGEGQKEEREDRDENDKKGETEAGTKGNEEGKVHEGLPRNETECSQVRGRKRGEGEQVDGLRETSFSVVLLLLPSNDVCGGSARGMEWREDEIQAAKEWLSRCLEASNWNSISVLSSPSFSSSVEVNASSASLSSCLSPSMTPFVEAPLAAAAEKAKANCTDASAELRGGFEGKATNACEVGEISPHSQLPPKRNTNSEEKRETPREGKDFLEAAPPLERLREASLTYQRAAGLLFSYPSFLQGQEDEMRRALYNTSLFRLWVVRQQARRLHPVDRVSRQREVAALRRRLTSGGYSWSFNTEDSAASSRSRGPLPSRFSAGRPSGDTTKNATERPLDPDGAGASEPFSDCTYTAARHGDKRGTSRAGSVSSFRPCFGSSPEVPSSVEGPERREERRELNGERDGDSGECVDCGGGVDTEPKSETAVESEKGTNEVVSDRPGRTALREGPESRDSRVSQLADDAAKRAQAAELFAADSHALPLSRLLVEREAKEKIRQEVRRLAAVEMKSHFYRAEVRSMHARFMRLFSPSLQAGEVAKPAGREARKQREASEAGSEAAREAGEEDGEEGGKRGGDGDEGKRETGDGEREKEEREENNGEEDGEGREQVGTSEGVRVLIPKAKRRGLEGNQEAANARDPPRSVCGFQTKSLAVFRAEKERPSAEPGEDSHPKSAPRNEAETPQEEEEEAAEVLRQRERLSVAQDFLRGLCGVRGGTGVSREKTDEELGGFDTRKAEAVERLLRLYSKRNLGSRESVVRQERLFNLRFGPCKEHPLETLRRLTRVFFLASASPPLAAGSADVAALSSSCSPSESVASASHERTPLLPCQDSSALASSLARAQTANRSFSSPPSSLHPPPVSRTPSAFSSVTPSTSRVELRDDVSSARSFSLSQKSHDDRDACPSASAASRPCMRPGTPSGCPAHASRLAAWLSHCMRMQVVNALWLLQVLQERRLLASEVSLGTFAAVLYAVTEPLWLGKALRVFFSRRRQTACVCRSGTHAVEDLNSGDVGGASTRTRRKREELKRREKRLEAVRRKEREGLFRDLSRGRESLFRGSPQLHALLTALRKPRHKLLDLQTKCGVDIAVPLARRAAAACVESCMQFAACRGSQLPFGESEESLCRNRPASGAAARSETDAQGGKQPAALPSRESFCRSESDAHASSTLSVGACKPPVPATPFAEAGTPSQVSFQLKRVADENKAPHAGGGVERRTGAIASPQETLPGVPTAEEGGAHLTGGFGRVGGGHFVEQSFFEEAACACEKEWRKAILRHAVQVLTQVAHLPPGDGGVPAAAIEKARRAAERLSSVF